MHIIKNTKYAVNHKLVKVKGPQITQKHLNSSSSPPSVCLFAWLSIYRSRALLNVSLVQSVVSAGMTKFPTYFDSGLKNYSANYKHKALSSSSFVYLLKRFAV